MIREIYYGDITDRMTNPGDIIIGMNTKLLEASALGWRFVHDVVALGEIQLGSVLTFNFDEKRLLHMLVCHHLGPEGWKDADRYVRFCLDYLWQQHNDRKYGIVQIGAGPVGRRDGANVSLIRTAMADSFLEVDLILLPKSIEARTAVDLPRSSPLRVWDMGKGERQIKVS